MMALFVNLFLVYSVFGVPNLIEGLALRTLHFGFLI